jgi:branched-subunit amino acid aminotransferase/4-amino-4-deoxychorismate lyase
MTANASKDSLLKTRRIGSYTTARVTHGRVERVERHACRLLRDARRLELPPPALRDIEELFIETAAARFGTGDGIIRVEWSHTEGGAPELIATPRPLDEEPEVWRARTSRAIHPGPEHRRNTKFVDVHAYDTARAEVAQASIDESLLFDKDGWLVEGGRSNSLVVTKSGKWVTPDPALGGVEGLGLTLTLESNPEIRFGRLTLEDIRSARELMSVNVVRGVVSIVELDGAAIADGQIGDRSRSLTMFFRHE